MTDQQIADLGPAFSAHLGRYRACFGQKRTAVHFASYCRGLLSDLPRKSVEPIALEAGTAVRTLQEFLVTARWDHTLARDLLQRQFVAEVPVNFTVRRTASSEPRRADEYQPARGTKRWTRVRLSRKTLAAQVWRAKRVRVWAADEWRVLVTAVNERMGEVKYLVSNAVDEPLERLVRVAFRRGTVEHAFRLAKQEAELMDYEGRDDTGLVRHQILSLVVLGVPHEKRTRS